MLHPRKKVGLNDLGDRCLPIAVYELLNQALVPREMGCLDKSLIAEWCEYVWDRKSLSR